MAGEPVTAVQRGYNDRGPSIRSISLTITLLLLILGSLFAVAVVVLLTQLFRDMGSGVKINLSSQSVTDTAREGAGSVGNMASGWAQASPWPGSIPSSFPPGIPIPNPGTTSGKSSTSSAQGSLRTLSGKVMAKNSSSITINNGGKTYTFAIVSSTAVDTTGTTNGIQVGETATVTYRPGVTHNGTTQATRISQ